MSELAHVLRLDARRTALLIVVPVLSAIGLATAWRSLFPGVASWDNAVVALSESVRLLGPVAAGLAAWVAVREHRLDYLRGLAARSPATGPLLDLLLLTSATLLAYTAVALVLGAEVIAGGEAGRPQPLGVLAGAAALAMHVALGYIAGRFAPYPVIAALVAAVTWLWAALRGAGSSWWSLLPPAVLGHVELFTGLRPSVLADQVLWAVSLTVAMVFAYVWAVTRHALPAMVMALALALTAVSTVRLQSSGGVAVAPASAGRACREWPLMVCVHPALRSALPALEAALTPLAGRLAGTPGAFTRVEQRPPTRPAEVRGGVAYVHLADLAPGFDARAAQEIPYALVDQVACSDPFRSRAAAYTRVVDAWLLDRERPQGAGSARFARWSEGHRMSWLRTHYAAYRTCTLTWRDFRETSA